MQKRVIASLDYTYSAGKLMAFIFGALGLLGVIALVIIASINTFNINKFLDSPFHESSLPYLLPGSAAILMLLIACITLLINFRKRNKINQLIKNGTRKEASIVSSIQDFSVTNNKVPRRIVKFKTNDGKIYTFKSFDYGLVPHLTESKVVPIIHNEKGDTFPDPDFFIDQIDNQSLTSTDSFETQFAEKCMSNGDDHFKNKNYAGALMAYEMAYEKETSEKVIRKIAEAHEKLGNSEEAKAFLRKLD